MTEYVIVYAYAVDGDSRRIPMILKNKPDNLKGKLNLPGGKIEAGESPVEAAVRELKEETGLEDLGITDGMCPVGPEVMGTIRAWLPKIGVSTIYCVIVPITFRQELKQRSVETEPVDWYDFYDLMQDQKLIVNLRIVIPLMQSGVKGWCITENPDTGDNRIHFYQDGYDKKVFREQGKIQYPNQEN